MRFSLANLLVIVVILALAIGWYHSQRQIAVLNRIHAEKIDETLGGISISSNAKTHLFLAIARKTHNEAQFKRKIESKLIWAIFRLCSEEEIVDKAEGEKGYATYLCQQILLVIECKDVVAFFNFARENFGSTPDMVDAFPIIFDESSAEYRKLAEFIERSFNNKYVARFAK